jgi:hypothetical protein
MQKGLIRYISKESAKRMQTLDIPELKEQYAELIKLRQDVLMKKSLKPGFVNLYRVVETRHEIKEVKVKFINEITEQFAGSLIRLISRSYPKELSDFE